MLELELLEFVRLGAALDELELLGEEEVLDGLLRFDSNEDERLKPLLDEGVDRIVVLEGRSLVVLPRLTGEVTRL